jgi:hypothetical protein
MGANDPIGPTSRHGNAENHGQRQLEPGRDPYVKATAARKDGGTLLSVHSRNLYWTERGKEILESTRRDATNERG